MVKVRNIQRGAAVLVLAGAATAISLTATAASPTTTPRASVPSCRNGQLVNWLDTASNGAAGTTYYWLQFTNVSSHRCELYGYPGVSAVNRSGRQIGAAAERNASSVRTVMLAAGETARASLGIVVTANFPPSTCRSVTADGLRVYAPNLTASDVIPFPFPTCSRKADVSLSIGAVTH